MALRRLDRYRSLAARCIDAGYSSVIIDGSRLSFSENCSLTRSVVELAAGVFSRG